MSAPASSSQHNRLPAVPETPTKALDMDQAQQMKLRERQRFFEEVFQHDVDFYFPTTLLHIDHKRPPIGSISSMEVNVDMLEQFDLLDISDQETLDVFFSASTDENSNTTSLSGDDIHSEEFKRNASTAIETKSRLSSISSVSSDPNSLDVSEEGVQTPIIQSDNEEEEEEEATPAENLSLSAQHLKDTVS